MESEKNNQDTQNEELKKPAGQKADKELNRPENSGAVQAESSTENGNSDSGDDGEKEAGRGRDSGKRKYHQNNRRQNYRKKGQGKSDDNEQLKPGTEEENPDTDTKAGSAVNSSSEENSAGEAAESDSASDNSNRSGGRSARQPSGYDPHKVIIEGLDKYFDDRDKPGSPDKGDAPAEKDEHYTGREDDEVLPEKPAPPIVIRPQEPKPVEIISKKEQLLKSMQGNQPKQPTEVPEVQRAAVIPPPPPPPVMRTPQNFQKEQAPVSQQETARTVSQETPAPVQEKAPTQENTRSQERTPAQEKVQPSERNQNQNQGQNQSQGQSQNYGSRHEKRDNRESRDNRDSRDNRNKRVKDLRKSPNQQQGYKNQPQERTQEKKEPQFQPPQPPQRFRTSFRKISIVIPLYNEEDAIPPLTMEIKNVLREQNLNAEVIFVDDGSTDKSLRLIKDICRTDNRFRYISFQKNYGKSAALNIGFHNVKGDAVITMDADLQDDPKEIPALLKKLEEGYDLVSGWKKKRFDPFIKKYTSRIFNGVTSLMSGIKLHDFNCGLKAYKRYVTDDLRIYGEMHRYIPILAHWRGYSVTELPVKHHPRRYGVTKFGASRFFKGFVDLLTVMFITRYIKRPMHLFGFLGALSFFIGLLVNGYLTWLWIHGIPLSNRPLLFFGMLLMIVGVQFFTTGLLGELMVHNFQTDKEYNIKDTNIQGS